MPTNLFVYGTLMRGESREGYLSDQEFVGSAETAPGYRLYNVGAYPALVVSIPGVSVVGELWRVGDDKLLELDDVEGIDEGLYARRPVQLLSPHDSLMVETYVFRPSVSGLADIGGNWRKR